MDNDAAQRLSLVQEQMATAARAIGRAPCDVTLVAVSKTFGEGDIAPVIAAGQRVFGENRVQEAQVKWPALKARYPDIELHLIGPLQSNKAAAAVELFDVIETLDRDKLARVLAVEMRRQNRRPRLFVQVNTGGEEQKAGIPPRDADAFLRRCHDAHGLAVEGLMCIPPVDEDPDPHFKLLAQIARANNLAWLSMGMSADFEVAIAKGATHVRIGSAIFGPR